MLIPESANPWDENAIAVYIPRPTGAMKVGYLTRENAVTYAPVFQAIAPARAIKAEAHIRPSWAQPNGRPLPPGVKLHLGTPGELAAEMWLDKHPVRVDHRWACKTLAFTGGSVFAIHGVRLDSAGDGVPRPPSGL